MQERIQVLAGLLAREGFRFSFGVTGSGPSLALITALEDAGVRYYPAAHEASAAIMAGAVSRISLPALSVSIRGPGLANMLPGIVHNHFENNPALSLSEAFGTEVPPSRRHKRLDHSALLSTVVKGMASLDEIESQLPALLCAARAEVPGPVHLDLCDGRVKAPIAIPPVRPPGFALDASVKEEILQRLRFAQRPLLIVGSLATRRGWREKLASLRVPVFTTASAKGVLDERLAHSAGVFTGEGRDLAPEAHLFAAADMVAAIGLRNTEVLSAKPLGRPTVLVDEVNEGLAAGFESDLFFSAADPELVSSVLDEFSSKSWGLEMIARLRQRMRAALLEGGWLPSACFEVLNDLSFPYGLVLDTGAFCTIGEHLWRAAPGRLFLGSSHGRMVGVAIPSALGMAIGKEGLAVFCVIGDGGMQAYPAEIKLAVEERLPICFVLMTDGRYGSVAAAAPGGRAGQRAFTVFRPSWWRAIETMGCEACRIDSETSFATAVQAWGRAGPLFIEAAFEAEPYAAMTRSLRG